MSFVLWRIAQDTPDYEAHDLSGKGAETTGGRWNRKGLPVVYTTTSTALACLETIVHFGAAGLPLNRYLVRITVPDVVWNGRATLDVSSAVGWDAIPPGKVSMDLGDAWLKKAAAAILVVPSAIAPEDHNVLINPRHPDARAMTAIKLRKWVYDGRLA